MGVWFEPEEIDDLDETLLDAMDAEELAEFRGQLEETLDENADFLKQRSSGSCSHASPGPSIAPLTQ